MQANGQALSTSRSVLHVLPGQDQQRLKIDGDDGIRTHDLLSAIQFHVVWYFLVPVA
jgi:hypothetical protein